MPNLVYSFTFPRRALGLDVTITDNAGQTVSIEEDPALVLSAANGNAYIELTLPDEDAPYSGAVSSARVGSFASEGSVALAASIADAPGAAETAYFVGTGPVYATDGSGAAGTIVFVADTEQGDLPAWASVVDGDIVLDEDTAGTCAYSFRGVMDMDFTETTPPTATGTISAGYYLKIDGDVLDDTMSDDTTTADGEDLQTTNDNRSGQLLVGSVITVEAYPSADDGGNIPDGVATPRCAFNVTRLAPGATVPDPA